jgi:hypothetical protein
VRIAVLALAAVGGIDALEEYFPLLGQAWGVPTGVIPLAVLGIPLAGAAGAAVAGRLTRMRHDVVLGGAAVLLAAAALLHVAAGIAVVAVSYALYRAVLVVVDTRCQERITGTARATVTSVAAVGEELACFLVYGAWAVGQALGVAVLIGLIAVALSRLR